MSIFQVAVSLFFVFNAIGNIPLFIGILGKFSPRKQRRIILRELLIALVLLLIFNFFGDDILRILGISQPIIGIAGGTLLFLIALSMIFPKPVTSPTEVSEEPFIVPLAIPLVAGPGSIASVMIYAEQVHNHWLMTGAILLAWLPSAILLFSASNIRGILGSKGLAACERLGGMLICLISVKMIATGVITLMQTVQPK